MRRLIVCAALLASLSLIAAACGGEGRDGDGRPTPLTLTNEGIAPIPANSEVVVGPNRFALGLIDQANKPILGRPGTNVRLRFFFDGELKEEQAARFVWAIPDANGFFVADVSFDQAGTWEAEAVLTQDGEETTIRRLTFPVRAESQTPNIGDPAPAATNLTLGQEPNIKRITTDEKPDQAFYQMTVIEALSASKPFVLVFATPAFCQWRFCGPILDNVKALRPEFVDQVNFIHIEPFELDAEGKLVTTDSGPVVAAPTEAWKLQSEPWVFVVDAQGRIAARFEGAASPEELRAAIQAVVG